MTDLPRRGDIWTTDTGIDVLVISSTVYNEIASEPTVIVVPVSRADCAILRGKASSRRTRVTWFCPT